MSTLSNTKVYKTYVDFLLRPWKDGLKNGVTQEWLDAHPEYDDSTIQSCWCCTRCTNCKACKMCKGCVRCHHCDSCDNCYMCRSCRCCWSCIRCGDCHESYGLMRERGLRKISVGTVYTSLVSKDGCRDICSPRIYENGEQWIQIGTCVRPRDDWEHDVSFAQNYPVDDGVFRVCSPKVLKRAFKWLDRIAKKHNKHFVSNTTNKQD